MLILKTLDNDFEAEMLKTFLRNNGIDAEIKIDKIPGNIGTKGAYILVPPEQMKEAEKLLEKGIDISPDEAYDSLNELTEDQIDDETGRKCPFCGGTDTMRKLKPNIVILCIVVFPLLLFIPFFFIFSEHFSSVFYFECNTCKNTF